MKKLILILSALSTLGIIGLYYYTAKQKSSSKRIALFVPAVHPAMDEIVTGFKQTLDPENKTYTFDTFNANGNKTLLRAQAEEISERDYDLVFTIGTLCSHTMFTLNSKKLLTTPLVFTAIDDPVNIGVTQQARAAGAPVTGTTIADDFDAQLAYLLKIKPYTQTILFVYDPAHGTGMQKVRNTLQAAAQRKGITLKTAEVFASNELQQKVLPMLNGIDVIMMYTDHTVVAGIDSLIKFCNQHGVTLYASDLNSGQKGAALAFGVHEYEHGTQTALKALSILESNTPAHQVPITPVTNYKLAINTKTMRQQGLDLSQKQLDSLLEAPNIIIGNHCE